MKKMIMKFCIGLMSFALLSCATTSKNSKDLAPQESSLHYNIPKGMEFELEKGITAIITNYKPAKKSIKHKGKYYTPGGTGNVAFCATLQITNKTDKVLHTIPYDKLELVTANDKTEFVYTSYTRPSDSSNLADLFKKNALIDGEKNNGLASGASLTDEIYFIYPEVNSLVAITNERTPVITFYNESTPNVAIIDEKLEKIPYVTECFKMTKNASSEEIETFMNKHGVTYADKDMNGLTLIVHAIVNKNNAVFDKALEHSDLTILLQTGIGYDKVDLLGIAALQGNKYACDKLIAKGFTINKKTATLEEKQNPAIVAIRNNNMPALRFIVEVLQFDVSELKIPMAWSPSIDAEKYCRDRDLTEMADYLASKKKEM